MTKANIACWSPGPNEITWHFAIRHQVFVEEQRVMVFTDVDDHDRDPDTIHVVAAIGNQVAGTVRLYQQGSNGRWKGDRLAVLPEHRSSLVGMRLVRFAVSTAAACGGGEMEASVQVANTTFFERLGWSRDGEVAPYFGLPHQPMAISLVGAAAALESRPQFDDLHLPIAGPFPSPLLAAV